MPATDRAYRAVLSQLLAEKVNPHRELLQTKCKDRNRARDRNSKFGRLVRARRLQTQKQPALAS